MRIDRAKHFEANIRQMQLHVNKLVAAGWSQQQIAETLDKTPFSLRKGMEEPVSCSVRFFLEPSHLKKGYIVYFICHRCQRKVRNLYLFGFDLGCRHCLGLTYKKQNRRLAEIRRLVTNDKLLEQYWDSDFSSRRIWLAMEAGGAKEELIEAGKRLGRDFVKEVMKRNKTFR